MLIKITERERATIVASLRRWHSYPAAREADALATSGGKHSPLDNAEIERLCERFTKARGPAPLPRRSDNSTHEASKASR